MRACSRIWSSSAGESAHPGPDSLVEPLILIVAGACVGALLIPSLGFVVTRVRAMFLAWRGRRRRIRAAATAELRARAMMSELCPHGWRAQITLYEGSAEQGERRAATGMRSPWTGSS